MQIQDIDFSTDHPRIPMAAGAEMIDKNRTIMKLVIRGEDKQGRPSAIEETIEYETTFEEEEHLVKLFREVIRKLSPPKHNQYERNPERP